MAVAPNETAAPTPPPTDHEIAEVLNLAGAWPPGRRIALVERLLGTVRAELEAPTSARPSLRNLVGLARLDVPPPDDEECRRILEEELMRKHLR